MSQILNGRYELEQKIGDGGMAVVYRGRDRVLGRTVAVKILRDQYVADAAFLSRFQREAQSAAALSHPNIVNIYDVGEDQGLHYIVMEYVPGRNLKELIRAEGPLSPRQAVDLGRQICAALGYAHARGLVHRDVKPQNILVTPEGLVKVADFGIAKGSHDAHLTATGIAMGTVHYAAPEQIEGEETTPASDIYAAGVVLYEMLTGRLPFDGETPVSIALKHINEAPLRLRTYNPQVPAGLETIVLTALGKNPAERFPTAEALGQALLDYQYFSAPRAAGVGSGASARTAAVPVQRLAGGGRPVGGRAALDARSGALPRARAATATRRAPGAATGPRDDIGCLTWLAGVIGLGLLLGLLLVGFNVLPRVLGDRPQLSVPTATQGAPTPNPAVKKPGSPAAVGTAPRAPAAAVTTTGTATPTVTPTVTITPTATITPTPTTPPSPTPIPRLPDLRGRTLEEAQRVLQPLGVSQIEFTEPGVFNERIPAGRIVDQTPAAGTVMQPGSSVRVTLSRGPATIVPDLRSQEVALASRLLTDRGLQVKTTEEGSRDVPPGRVIRSEPPAGSQIEGNGTVTLVVSVGDQARVPDLFGKPLPEARAALEAAGLRLGTVTEQTRDQVPADQRAAFDQVPPGGVLSASPNYGTFVNRGTEVIVAIRKP